MGLDYDVIIIGAGVSGLTIACDLLAKKPLAKLLILEANGHVGGRCWAVNGIDIGATWIHSCDGVDQYAHIADTQVCKTLSCDRYVDPDVDIVFGIEPQVVEEYNKLYKNFARGSRRKSYDSFVKHLQQYPNSHLLLQILKYHRAKLGFQEPQGKYLDTHAYAQDALPKTTMYGTFVEPLLRNVQHMIRTRTPVKAVHRNPSGHFEVYTSQGCYICKNLVYTGTFPALNNIQVSNDVLPLTLRKRMDDVVYIKALKVVWKVDDLSDKALQNMFGKRRQLHVPNLPWTIMLHEKKGYLYTYAVGPTYEMIQGQSLKKLRKDLQQALNIQITDQFHFDYNKNKYFQQSYASLVSSSQRVHRQLMNPSSGFYMCGDMIIAPSKMQKWERCVGTVTGAIRTAHSVASLIMNDLKI